MKKEIIFVYIVMLLSGIGYTIIGITSYPNTKSYIGIMTHFVFGLTNGYFIGLGFCIVKKLWDNV